MSQASTSNLGPDHRPSQGFSFSETPSPPRPILNSDKAVLEWQRSTGYRAFWSWIIRRCERIKGREIMYGESDHSAINSWLMLIDSMIRWVQEIPPYPQSNQRFGNLAFREYIKLVESRLADLITSFPSISPALVSQLLPLLIDSTAFGQPTRLDYGTGHELAFVLGLWCCVVSGFVDGEEVEDELVLRVFPRYLDLVTLLQQTYKLEPAGSHGVWGLDDYCFFPYLFGSAQLLDSQTTPKQALTTAQKRNPENITDLYTLSLNRITLFKKGASFSEHSPLLYQLSSFPNWTKPHMGLRKMFSGEVSGKRVVVQGIWVGGWVWGEDLPLESESGTDSGPGRRAGRGLGGDGSGVESLDQVKMTPAPWKVDSRMKTLEATKGDGGGGMLSQRR